MQKGQKKSVEELLNRHNIHLTTTTRQIISRSLMRDYEAAGRESDRVALVWSRVSLSASDIDPLYPHGFTHQNNSGCSLIKPSNILLLSSRVLTSDNARWKLTNIATISWASRRLSSCIQYVINGSKSMILSASWSTNPNNQVSIIWAITTLDISQRFSLSFVLPPIGR